MTFSNDVIVFLDFFFFPFSLAPRCAYISVGWLRLLEIFEYPTFVTNMRTFPYIERLPMK